MGGADELNQWMVWMEVIKYFATSVRACFMIPIYNTILQLGLQEIKISISKPRKSYLSFE